MPNTQIRWPQVDERRTETRRAADMIRPGDVDQIATAIRKLPLTAGRLKTLIVAVENYASECGVSGDTSDVCALLQDALGAADSLVAWQREAA